MQTEASHQPAKTKRSRADRQRQAVHSGRPAGAGLPETHAVVRGGAVGARGQGRPHCLPRGQLVTHCPSRWRRPAWQSTQLVSLGPTQVSQPAAHRSHLPKEHGGGGRVTPGAHGRGRVTPGAHGRGRVTSGAHGGRRHIWSAWEREGYIWSAWGTEAHLERMGEGGLHLERMGDGGTSGAHGRGRVTSGAHGGRRHIWSAWEREGYIWSAWGTEAHLERMGEGGLHLECMGDGGTSGAHGRGRVTSGAHGGRRHIWSAWGTGAHLERMGGRGRITRVVMFGITCIVVYFQAHCWVQTSEAVEDSASRPEPIPRAQAPNNRRSFCVLRRCSLT